MRKIITLVVVLVAGIIIYNNFYGSEEDKARGQEVKKEFKELASSVFGLLKAEKDNFSDGKYDGALDKVGLIFEDLGQKAKELGGDYPEKVDELEQQLEEIKNQTEQNKNSRVADPEAQKKEMDEKMDSLVDDLKKLTEEMSNK